MKKEYTKPGIVKVDLNHEQAILGTCKSGAVDARDSTGQYCKANCKRNSTSQGTDTGATS